VLTKSAAEIASGADRCTQDVVDASGRRAARSIRRFPRQSSRPRIDHNLAAIRLAAVTAITTDGSDKAHQMRHGQLGLRRRVITGDRHVVGARQCQDCALPVDEQKVPTTFCKWIRPRFKWWIQSYKAVPIRSSTSSYDVASKKSTRIDVRDGKPFENSAVGHYVHVSCRQMAPSFFQPHEPTPNVLEFVAANPSTARRVIVHENGRRLD
jgi:hypothetical protein